jgi:hypothetical protein
VVVAPAAEQQVSPGPPVELIIAGAPVQTVVTGRTDQPIAAAVAELAATGVLPSSTLAAHRSSPVKRDPTDTRGPRAGVRAIPMRRPQRHFSTNISWNKDKKQDNRF